ncbi:MAG: transposase [Haloarculaceae archaeon]
MPAPDDVPVSKLRTALPDLEDPRAVERAMVAIAYAEGVSQTDLAAWYGRSRKTVYNWIDRAIAGPIPEALTDDDRTGRPRKLSSAQRARLDDALSRTPAAAGFDADAWTPALVNAYVSERFGVDYSRATCRRLMANSNE